MDGVYATSRSGIGVAIAMDGVYATCRGDRPVARATVDITEHSLKAPMCEIGVLIDV
jgi:hypothetical protein